jgi:ABC-type branched-subunit amino acid transport system substrate-binding protein
MSTPATTGNGVSELREGLRLLMRGGGPKLVAACLTLSLIIGLSFLSVVEANHRAHKTTVSASGTQAGSAGENALGAPSAGTPNGSGQGSAPSGEGTGTQNAVGVIGGTTGGGKGPNVVGNTVGTQTNGGSSCPPGNDASIGVSCNQILVGGITVLSGPLGIYGEQGLQGGQAWLSYYNSVYAPQHHLRSEKLIYYDDHGADPSQDAILTQKLVEQDHVLSLGGMPAPQGANPYLVQHGVPLIGDLGLNPISFASPMIFPTAPTPDVLVGAQLEAKYAHQQFPTAKKIGYLWSPLPGQDPAPFEQYARQAWAAYGADVVFQVMQTSETDCNSHLLQIKSANPDYLILPYPSTNFLLCIQAAQTQNYYPGSAFGQNLKGWQGGSGIQVEMQQCGSLCATAGGGIFSVGNIYYNPNDYSNHDPTWGMDLYNANMAKYAPNVDKTSIISENYYVSGVLGSMLLQQTAASAPYLTRAHLIDVANHFKLDTAMGLVLDWADPPNTPNAHIGTTCGFAVRAAFDSHGNPYWHTIPTKVCP